MAEFCLDCFNELEETSYSPKDVRLSLMRELCEGCGEPRRVVVGLKRRSPISLWLERRAKKTGPK